MFTNPLQIDEVSSHMLVMHDAAGEEVCLFYMEQDTIDDHLRQKAKFVQRACAELIRKEAGL